MYLPAGVQDAYRVYVLAFSYFFWGCMTGRKSKKRQSLLKVIVVWNRWWRIIYRHFTWSLNDDSLQCNIKYVYIIYIVWEICVQQYFHVYNDIVRTLKIVMYIKVIIFGMQGYGKLFCYASIFSLYILKYFIFLIQLIRSMKIYEQTVLGILTKNRLRIKFIN